MYTHTLVLLVSWFWSTARDQYRIAVNQRKEQKAKQFPNGYFIKSFNIKFSSFAIQNSYLKFAVLSVYLLLLYICTLNSFLGAFRLPQCKSGDSLLVMPIFEHLNLVWVVAFCLWSLHFICNNCTFIFLYPLTPEFFSPPSPHSYIHSWTTVSGKVPWWKDQNRSSDHSSVFSLE